MKVRTLPTDGILTLVDVVHASEQLDQHRVAAAQVGFADRLLLTKPIWSNKAKLMN
jgi:G3E family GTPase